MPVHFFHPRYWITWLGVALLRLIIILPWRWQMALGKAIGIVLYYLFPSRRRISCINLKIAFPERTPLERKNLNRQHFISLGQGLIEAALGWWGKDSQIEKLTHIEGLEHLQSTLKKDPVILLGSHFASLEVGGRIFAKHMPLHAVYRPHQNSLIEYLVAQKRNSQYGKVIPKSNIREMIKSIADGFPVWYATDQNYRAKGSIMVPFFGVDTPTNPGTSRLAKITGAKIIPAIAVRLTQGKQKGYLVRFYPPLADFPGKDPLQDTTRLNQIIEQQIREFPEQYLWTHKRYKQYTSENHDFYRDFSIDNPKTEC